MNKQWACFTRQYCIYELFSNTSSIGPANFVRLLSTPESIHAKTAPGPLLLRQKIVVSFTGWCVITGLDWTTGLTFNHFPVQPKSIVRLVQFFIGTHSSYTVYSGHPLGSSQLGGMDFGFGAGGGGGGGAQISA